MATSNIFSKDSDKLNEIPILHPLPISVNKPFESHERQRPVGLVCVNKGD
jgi:hypothetical protein